jgi:hypothetical protein
VAALFTRIVAAALVLTALAAPAAEARIAVHGHLHVSRPRAPKPADAQSFRSQRCFEGH